MTSSLIGTGIIGIVIAAFSITMNSFQKSSRALAQKMEITQLQSNIKGRLADGSLCGCNLMVENLVSDPATSPYTDRSPSPTPTPGRGQGGQTSGTATGGAQIGDEDDDRPGWQEPGPGLEGFGQAVLQINVQNLQDLALPLESLQGRCPGSGPPQPIVQANQDVQNSLTGLAVTNIRVEGFQATATNLLSADIVIQFNPDRMVIGRKPMRIPITMQVTAVAGGMVNVNSCSTQEMSASAAPNSAPIPPTVAGDPGTQCRYGLNNGPLGITMYRGAGATNGGLSPTATPYRLCCLVGANRAFNQTLPPGELALACAAYL